MVDKWVSLLIYKEIGTWVTITDKTTSHERQLVKVFNLTLKLLYIFLKQTMQFFQANMYVFNMKN